MSLKSHFVGTVLILVTTFSISAQDRDTPQNGPGQNHTRLRAGQDSASPSDASPSDMVEGIHPDLLMHLQEMQRYETARDGGRAAAAEKARQRRARLAAARWYGHSPLRPMVSSIPMMGSYFPVSNSDVTRPAQWFHTRSAD
jgi:hypothetical protein